MTFLRVRRSASLYSDVLDWVDDDFVVDVVQLDFSKAFNVVSHYVLIHKLKEIGVGVVKLGQITYFLVCCSMRDAVVRQGK